MQNNIKKKFIPECPRTMLNLWDNFILSRYSSKIRFYIYSICQVRIQKQNMESPRKIRRKSILKFTFTSMENSPRRCVCQLFSPNFASMTPNFLFQIQIDHSLKIKWTKFHTNGVRKIDL